MFTYRLRWYFRTFYVNPIKVETELFKINEVKHYMPGWFGKGMKK